MCDNQRETVRPLPLGTQAEIQAAINRGETVITITAPFILCALVDMKTLGSTIFDCLKHEARRRGE